VCAYEGGYDRRDEVELQQPAGQEQGLHLDIILLNNLFQRIKKFKKVASTTSEYKIFRRQTVIVVFKKILIQRRAFLFRGKLKLDNTRYRYCRWVTTVTPGYRL
jgi:hypothetical protein